MARLAWLVNLIAFVFVTVGAEETATNNRPERQSENPNIFGVASVARITSRNGRISSSGGIQFYPGPGANIAKEFYSPATFIKAINGKYGTSSVQIHPGALSVSSSAKAGYIEPGYLPMDWPRQWQWPIQNYVFADPWDRVTQIPQTKMRQFVYPSFNPFMNFWR